MVFCYGSLNRLAQLYVKSFCLLTERSSGLKEGQALLCVKGNMSSGQLINA